MTAYVYWRKSLAFATIRAALLYGLEGEIAWKKRSIYAHIFTHSYDAGG